MINLRMLALPLIIGILMGCEDKGMTNPALDKPDPVVPCVQPIDSASLDRFEFAFVMDGFPLKRSGVRTYTRIGGIGVSDSFDVVDSGISVSMTDSGWDTAAYFGRFQERNPVTSFRTLKGLENSLWPGFPALSIAGCAETWTDTVSVSNGREPSRFFLAGDSLEYEGGESHYDIIGRGGSTSLRYAYDIRKGLMAFEITRRFYMTGTYSLFLYRIGK